MNSKLIFPLLVFCLFFISCGKKETEISGEVFVVTKGAGNYKFGLVQIGVVSLEAAKQYLKNQQSFVTKSWNEALASDAKCDKWVEDFSKYESDYRTEKLISDCRDSAKNDLEAVYSHYFVDIPQIIVSVETDSDGKFTLKIPKPGKYAIFAKAERTVTDARREQYFWILEIEADGTPQKLSLSNKNMVSSDAASSLIKAGG